MRRQLQIKNGVAVSEWQGRTGMPIPPDGSWLFVDVTDRPGALVGQLYDQATDTFTPPPAAPSLSYYEFIQLFTLAERKALRALAATNEDVADTLDLLRSAPTIPIRAPKIGQMLQQLVTAGILTPARRTAILT